MVGEDINKGWQEGGVEVSGEEKRREIWHGHDWEKDKNEENEVKNEKRRNTKLG